MPGTDKTTSKSATLTLEQRLKTLIAQRGPISIADYMADALSHPQEGYYMSGSPIGAQGDFTTAPEISQLFGEIIGLWLVQSWLDMGSPDAFNLIELGPGRGVLMSDILRAARLRPNFLRAANVWFVENSGRMRLEQKKRMDLHSEIKVNWVDRYNDIPEGPCLLIANEFFDCLPIQQFEKTHLGWHERMVGMDPTKDTLTYELAPAPIPLDHPLAKEETAKDKDIIEICTPATKLISQIAKTLHNHKGRALIIDYGHYSSAFGDTFQAIRNHEFCAPLEKPGTADLTAHVDFQMLGDTAIHENTSVYGAVSQGTFLDRLGLVYRLQALCRGKTQEEQEALRAGANRLSAADQMGELFKVMCMANPELEPPAGFENG